MNVNENIFGMSLISSNRLVPIESLQFNRNYQRSVEKARVEKVKSSMCECGMFLPGEALTVNQNNEIVDGQHRYIAAKELDYSEVPVIKYRFESVEKEAAFFMHINNYDPRLSTVDHWFGLLASGDPFAELMYFLDENSSSALYNKIALKGRQTKKTKMTISQAAECVLTAVGENSNNWDKVRHKKQAARVCSMSRPVILKNLNQFVRWYEEIFGTKQDAPWAYRVDSFRAVRMLYGRLKEKGLHDNKSTINKMKSFNMDASFIAAPIQGKKYQLIDHFNKNRKTNRIEYSIDSQATTRE